MENIFEINSIESKLEYIKSVAHSVFERVQSELTEGDAVADFRNRLIVSKAVFEAFESSGKEAIITTDIYDVPAVQHYLTKGTAAHINGKYKVVDSRCFTHCSSLETIVFDDGVECIKESVLCDNTLIKNITFPKTVNYIGNDAFRNCENLSEVVFLNPNTWISPDAFEGTKWFSQFTEDFVVVNGQLLKYNGNYEDIIIPEGTIHISHQVFNENQNIKSVTCPSTLEGIWTYSFADCPNLNKVVFNDNLSMICISAFEDCAKLNEVYLPRNLKDLGAMAFNRKTIIHFYDTDKELTKNIKETYPNHVIIE